MKTKTPRKKKAPSGFVSLDDVLRVVCTMTPLTVLRDEVIAWIDAGLFPKADHGEFWSYSAFEGWLKCIPDQCRNSDTLSIQSTPI